MIHCPYYILPENFTLLQSVSGILEADEKIRILAKSWTLVQMIPDINENINAWMEFDKVFYVCGIISLDNCPIYKI